MDLVEIASFMRSLCCRNVEEVTRGWCIRPSRPCFPSRSDGGPNTATVRPRTVARVWRGEFWRPGQWCRAAIGGY